MKISATHDKNRISLLYLLINCVSNRSAPYIFSIKNENNLHFFVFLVISFCSSSFRYRLDHVAETSDPKSKVHWFAVPVYKHQHFSIKDLMNYLSKILLVSILFRVFSNTKHFITQFVIRRNSGR